MLWKLKSYEDTLCSQIQSTTYSSSPTYDQQYLEKPTDEVMTQSLAAQLLNQQPLSTYDRSVMMTPHQAAGEYINSLCLSIPKKPNDQVTVSFWNDFIDEHQSYFQENLNLPSS